jgi:hypothetical protein
MAKKELPKAQLAGIVKGIVKGYQGAKAGVKLASQIKKRAKNIKAIGITKKADAVAEAEKKAARLQKAADTREANKAAKARPASDTKKVIPKTETEIPPIVKSKNRQRLENASGKAVGALTYGTANITKKALKNRNVQGALIGTGIGLGVYRLLEGKRPVKIKKIKKK